MRPAALFCWAALCAPLLIASDFAGTWKRDHSKTRLTPAPTVTIDKTATGWHVTWSTAPPYDIVTDGKEHPTPQPSVFETATYRLVDARTLEQDGKRGGKPVGKIVWTVTPDGKEIRQVAEGVYANGQRYHNESRFKRTGAPAGADRFTGKWETEPVRSQAPVTYTISDVENGIEFHSSIGLTFKAKFDGKAYPATGTAETTVTLTRVDDHTIREVVQRRGSSSTRTSVLTVTGRQLTETSELPTPDGGAMKSVTVFDKQ